MIVGRCADYILKDRPDCLHVFIHADNAHRAARIRERYGETKQPMEKRLQEKDSKRKVYYKHYTNRNWGEAGNYDVCLDSGTLGVDKCVDIVCDIAEMLSLTPSAISHQLKLLKQFRLVKSRREGKTVYYSLADDHVRSIIDTGREHIEE